MRFKPKLTGVMRVGQALLMRFAAVVAVAAGLAFSVSGLHAAEPVWPKLPERDGAVMIPAQEWPLRPGPRQVRVLVHYPEGTRSSVGPRTGIFLTLHNWGGTDCAGTASPQVLAKEFNVVALCPIFDSLRFVAVFGGIRNGASGACRRQSRAW